jgi:hypothetical protein
MPDAPDSFVSEHDRKGNREMAMMERDIRAADAREVDSGDDCSWTGLGQRG